MYICTYINIYTYVCIGSRAAGREGGSLLSLLVISLLSLVIVVVVVIVLSGGALYQALIRLISDIEHLVST